MLCQGSSSLFDASIDLHVVFPFIFVDLCSCVFPLKLHFGILNKLSPKFQFVLIYSNVQLSAVLLPQTISSINYVVVCIS